MHHNIFKRNQNSVNMVKSIYNLNSGQVRTNTLWRAPKP